MKTLLLKSKHGNEFIVFIEKIVYLYAASETITTICFSDSENYIEVNINMKDLFEMIKNAYYL